MGSGEAIRLFSLVSMYTYINSAFAHLAIEVDQLFKLYSEHNSKPKVIAEFSCLKMTVYLFNLIGPVLGVYDIV